MIDKKKPVLNGLLILETHLYSCGLKDAADSSPNFLISKYLSIGTATKIEANVPNKIPINKESENPLNVVPPKTNNTKIITSVETPVKIVRDNVSLIP